MCVIKGMIYVNTCAKDDIQRNFSLQQDVKVIPLQIREEIEEKNLRGNSSSTLSAPDQGV